MKKLTRDFYQRNTVTVAKDLIGKRIVHKTGDRKTVVRITETEAYCGFNDPACHIYSGRITDRTKALVGPVGHAYVYLIYGMYYCFNIVAHKKGGAGGVFIRSAEPIEGVSKKNRTDGPGRLCIALGIDKRLYGEDLCGNKIYLLNGEKINPQKVVSTPRVNIDYAGKAKHYPWRFVLGVRSSPTGT